ncbi:hypothetical protein [Microbacterium sp. NPDC055683]
MTPIIVEASLLSHPLAVRSLKRNRSATPILALAPRSLWRDEHGPLELPWERIIPPARTVYLDDLTAPVEAVVHWLLDRHDKEHIAAVAVVTCTQTDDSPLLRLPYPALTLVASPWEPNFAIDDAVRALDSLSVVR